MAGAPARAVRLAGLALLLLAPIGCEPRPSRQLEAPRATTQQEIRKLLDAGWAALQVADTTGVDSTWAWVKEFYARRSDRAAWSGHSPHKRTRNLIAALPRLDEAGLDPRDYDVDALARLLAQAENRGPVARMTRATTLARLDVHLTWAFLRAAPHLRDGRVPRGLLDRDWTPRGRESDWLAALEDHHAQDPAGFLAGLEPRHPGYRRLREALARYRAIAAAGGWPEVPPGPPLTMGATGPRVSALIRRLAVTGDLPAEVRDTVFDARLARAVGGLQARNGIPRSGIVGEATRALLNVPVATRIRQIELNLERWRWLPDSLGRRRIEVNIPAYHLDLIDSETLARGMRVVVGKRESPTPVFSDAVVYVEANPTWTLPPSVVRQELVPALQRKHDYLAANRMYVVSMTGARRDTVDPRTVPWKLAASDSFPYLVIQPAGPDNPLGTVKLMCPNEYDVYLHDSPQRSRFRVATRDYSHGCVRVEEAVALADSLLRPVLGDSVTVDSLVARGTWRRIRLQRPVPVHFLYWTAWADSAGRVSFRDDIYGLDARLDQALTSRTPAQLMLNPKVGISALWLAAEARAREVADRAANRRFP